LTGGTEVLDPSYGIKQIGAGDKTPVSAEATFDNTPKKTSHAPVVIGSFLPAAADGQLIVDCIVNADMGDVLIPVDITTVDGHTAGGETVAALDQLVISYESRGRTITREVLATADTTKFPAITDIDDALRTAYRPVDLTSVKIEIYDESLETYTEIDSVTILNSTGEVNANKTGAAHAAEDCAYDYYTAIEDAKLEIVKADTSFITWRDYSDENGYIPVAQTVFDQDYDLELSAPAKDPVIRAAQGAVEASKHEYIGMTAA